MTTIETFKQKLLEEKKRLEGELGHLGTQKGDHWDATLTDTTEKAVDAPGKEADWNDEASNIAEFEERHAVEIPLEARYHEVEAALARMETGTYGWCTTDGEKHEIEPARLLANPAALTCTAHAK
jgi:RNA polymerase-binding transcription factor DksA